MNLSTIDFRIGATRPQVDLGAIPFQQWASPDEEPWALFYRIPQGYLVRFPGHADFELSQDGRALCGWPAPETSDEMMRHLYLNQVLPVALSKLGKLILHASAVQVGEGAVVFVGESGRGKSTLAASFATTGSRFLTDDGLALETRDGVCMAMPSHPSIRLWDDSQEALIDHDVTVAPPLQFTSKARLLAGKGIAFCEEPQPLLRVYFLGDDEPAETTFDRMNPGEALVELVQHSFLLDVDEQQVLAAHFEELTALVKRPMFYRLDYPRDYGTLAQVRQAIVDHVMEAGTAQ